MGLDHLAIMRRRSKRGGGSAEQAKLARRFGFNKVAVGLTAKVPIGGVTSGANVDGDTASGAGGSRAGVAASARALGPLSDHQGGFEAAQIKLVGLDLVSGDEIWCMNPSRSSATVLANGAGPTVDAQGLDADAVSLARLVTLHSSMLETKVALIVSMKSGLTLSWTLDASNGSLLPRVLSDVNNDSKGPVTSILALGTYGEARKGDLQYLLVYSSPSPSSEAVEGSTEGAEGGLGLGSDIVAQLFPSAPASAAVGQYVHQVDVASGLISSYQLTTVASEPASLQLWPIPLTTTWSTAGRPCSATTRSSSNTSTPTSCWSSTSRMPHLPLSSLPLLIVPTTHLLPLLVPAVPLLVRMLILTAPLISKTTTTMTAATMVVAVWAALTLPLALALVLAPLKANIYTRLSSTLSHPRSSTECS